MSAAALLLAAGELARRPAPVELRGSGNTDREGGSDVDYDVLGQMAQSVSSLAEMFARSYVPLVADRRW